MKKYCTEIILAIILLALSLISIFVGVIDIDIKDLLKEKNKALILTQPLYKDKVLHSEKEQIFFLQSNSQRFKATEIKSLY